MHVTEWRMHGAVCTHDSRAYAHGLSAVSDRLSEGELGANLHFAESWLEAIGNSTRMAPYTQKKAALVDGFQQVSAVQQCRNAGCAPFAAYSTLDNSVMRCSIRYCRVRFQA
jgi:hypothetical protein